ERVLPRWSAARLSLGRSRFQWKTQLGTASGYTVGAIAQFDGAVMRLRDLLRKHEADPGSGGFCCVERHEEVTGVGEAVAIVYNGDCDLASFAPPSNLDA